MIITEIIWPMVIVSLPAVNSSDNILNKRYYTTPSNFCQIEKEKNTLEYNYIKSQEYIRKNIEKYQDVLP